MDFSDSLRNYGAELTVRQRYFFPWIEVAGEVDVLQEPHEVLRGRDRAGLVVVLHLFGLDEQLGTVVGLGGRGVRRRARFFGWTRGWARRRGCDDRVGRGRRRPV